ncbi:MAG: hypothetical protein O3A21_09075, partial [Proteobacteria bacterium]|nr:hypothetical protein [Pseudomonadota bacterium]
RFIGFVGDAINVAARLLDCAKRRDIAISDDLYNGLRPPLQRRFSTRSHTAAKNLGEIPYWLWSDDTDRGLGRTDESLSIGDDG